MRVQVGLCGFREAQSRLFSAFDLLEVQKTFYQPPRPETAARWRERAGPGFVFTLKAWQLVTHRAHSPTYRRLTEPLTGRQRSRAGNCRWNDVTRMAWNRTREIADALKAESIVLQTPAGFRPDRTNLDRLETFLDTAPRDGREIVFEPRGRAWTHEIVESLAKRFRITHAVDPFHDRPATPAPHYYRLHGIPPYRYRHRYTDEELDILCDRLRDEPARVLFNNDRMAADARRLLDRLHGEDPHPVSRRTDG